MNYTDAQLKQLLAKMLPEKCRIEDNELWWNDVMDKLVLDTELLHLCWLVEEMLKTYECANYAADILDIDNNKVDGWSFHATWQQRTIALAKVKGIEL